FSDTMTFQIGASSSEKLDLDASTSLDSLTAALVAVSTNYEDGTTGVEIADVDLTGAAPVITAKTANTTIGLLETALNEIGAMRATFGANINRLNHTANNLANMKDNTEMAKGRIMDADFASESANMSKNSMLMQSGISMLKQAGQMPGMVMSLL